MKKLEIGDKIYTRISYDGLERKIRCRSRVVRITPTLAITHWGDKFKINSIDGACRKVPKDKQEQFVYTQVEYLIETEELKSAYQKQLLVRKFKEWFDFNQLNLETLLEIDNILKSIIK
jgi:protein tyrosine phosphatase